MSLSFSFALFLILIEVIFSQFKIKPVIGIYGNPYPEDNDTYINGTYYPISYVVWLESAGAEVMAIHYWYSLEQIDTILNKVNGVLFLGGGRILIKDGVWELKAKYIMEQALKIQLPVWGTCQGFQLMGLLMSNNLKLRYGFDDSNILHGPNLTNETKTSKMYNLFPEEDFEILQYKNSTIYNHHYGFYPEEFYKDVRLNELFKVTSISEDTKGLKFINSFEGKNETIKLYATQFHPEKNPYKRINYAVEQNIDSLKVSQLLVISFIEETRKNNNKFDSSNNDQGDRSQYDFFDTYKGTPNCNFNRKDECFYFSKREE